MTLYDRDIREPLFQWLEEKYGMVRIIEEKQTGKARADAVMVTVDEVIGIADEARLEELVGDIGRRGTFDYLDTDLLEVLRLVL